MIAPAADFVLPVDKPEGPTSHDVVRAARKALGNRRIGHTGTLDPFASGLLVLCVGRATRLAEYLTAMSKTYEAVAHLGVTTDTLDRDGRVVEERAGWETLERARVMGALAGFRGELEQMPPEYSAKKVGGVPAHRRIRRGESVELTPARVYIDDIELLALELPRVTFRVTCSSGTYVRALARDLGDALGVGAHLVGLRRTALGRLRVGDALAHADLHDADRVAAAVIAPLAALAHLPTVDVDADAVSRLVHGGAVPIPDGERGGTMWESDGPVVVAHAGALIAIGEAVAGMLQPRKVFLE